jgi:hypothetical protein
VQRDIFGYRGKKAKRRRRVDPRVVQGFVNAVQARAKAEAEVTHG